jgi:hypothetical protein
VRRTEASTGWVVYRMTLRPGEFGGNVVCEQREWDVIEVARPGFHLLVRAGIGTEQEAEKLARGTAGDIKLRKPWQQRRADRTRREALESVAHSQPMG